MLDSHSDAPAFPGVGAPLNLPNLTDDEQSSILARFLDGSFAAWADTAAAIKHCLHPIRLTGSSETTDTTTGEVRTFSSAEAPLGVLYVPCGNRRADVCPSCSRLYARDTFELIHTGVQGGKTVPEAVSANPLLFVTLTAPSFGHVHRAGKNGKRCRPRDRVQVCEHGRPLGCMARHGQDDPVVGSPLCWDCYDWETAAVWNWWAPELWRRTTIALRRELATRLGVKEKDLRTVASLQYAKVAEYQARGSVHFHALIRLDGPEPENSESATTSATPSPLTGRELTRCVEAAAAHVTYRALAVDGNDQPRHLHWGEQLDVRTVRERANVEDHDSMLSAAQVAGYVAKYASKDAVSKHNPHTAPPHLRRLMQTCKDLDARTRVHHGENISVAPYALLGKWASALGFRGHFSTKSRRYSVTLGALRRARARFASLLAESRATGEPIDTRDLEARLLADDDAETTLVIGSWTFQGTGWPEPGDAALAASAAARAREWDQWRAHERKTA